MLRSLQLVNPTRFLILILATGPVAAVKPMALL